MVNYSFTPQRHKIFMVLALNKNLQQMGFPGGSAGKESARSVGDLGLIPGLGRSSGEGNGYPLQYNNGLALPK